MIRIVSDEPVREVLTVINKLGAVLHLGLSRSILVMTPEDFARCIKAARDGGAQGAEDFFLDKQQ